MDATEAAREVLKIWPSDKPIGRAVEDIEDGADGRIELTADFTNAVFRMMAKDELTGGD